MGNIIVWKPEDFGAVANGINNDARAFWKTLEEAKNGGIIELQSGRTYYIASNDGCAEPIKYSSSGQILPASKSVEYSSAIELFGAKDLTIVGQGSTILIDSPLFYANINNCENITIKDVNFDYKTRPFAGADLLDMNVSEGWGDFKVDRSLNIEAEYKSRGDFGIIEREDGRRHMFIDSIIPVNPQKNIYRIYFDKTSDSTIFWMPLLKTYRLIVPMPYVGHRIERAFSIVGNTNFKMENCNIHSIARFGFALFQNEGEVAFNNVNLVPARDEKCKIVAWRDGYHVKENRAIFKWNRCSATYLYDDIFNLSSSMLEVNKVYAEDDIDLFWAETGSTYVPLKSGDTLTVFDYENGELIGSSKVDYVILQEGAVNRIKLTSPIKNIRAGKYIKVCFDNMVAPGSEIENCNFNGTLRFRGPISIRNSTFHITRMWIDIEREVEGPIPSGVKFYNCVFKTDDVENQYIHIKTQRLNNSTDNPYHVENIEFNQCELCLDTFEIGEEDIKFVTFEDCDLIKAPKLVKISV